MVNIKDIIIEFVLRVGFMVIHNKVLSIIVSPIVGLLYFLAGIIIGAKNGIDAFKLEWWNSYCKKK